MSDGCFRTFQNISNCAFNVSTYFVIIIIQLFNERIKSLKAKSTARVERIASILQRGTPDAKPI